MGKSGAYQVSLRGEKLHTGEKNMTEGNITMQLLVFSGPILAAQLLLQFYSMADAAVLGHFAQSLSLAAVGPASLLLSVILNFFTGFTTGISVLISQFYGKREYEKVKSSIETALGLCFGVGIIFTALGILFGKSFLFYLQTPAEVTNLAAAYLYICCPGITAQMITSAGTAILRALGNTRDPLYILGYTCILNIVLDILLVCVIPLGIQGAAAATLFSQFLSMVLILWKLKKISPKCRPSFKVHGLSFGLMKDLLVLGLPSGMQAIFMSISSLVIQTSINQFGPDAIAGMTVFAKVEGFVYYPLFSLGLALSGFMGQNCGAGRMDRVEQARKISLKLSVVFTLAAEVIVVVFSRQLLGLFTPDNAILHMGRQAVYWILPFYFLYAVNQIYIGCLRGCGHTFTPMLITLLCYSFFRVAWCRLLLPVIHSMVVVYTSYSVSFIPMMLLLILAWKKSEKNKIIT